MDACDRFAAAAAPIGIDIVTVAVVLLLSTIGFMAFYAVRCGTPDDDPDRAATEKTRSMGRSS